MRATTRDVAKPLGGGAGRAAKTMRALILPILAVAAGLGVGATTSMRKFQAPEILLAGHTATAAEQPVKIKDAKPRAYYEPGSESYDFGVMARDEEGSHTFHVKNIGAGPLTLKVLDTTCKCTVGELEQDEIAPGETANVTLTWSPTSYDREFRQSARIETSDQASREIVFSVTGQVIQLAIPDTPAVKLSRLSRSESKEFDFNVYGYRDEDLQIVSHQFSSSETAEFFSVETEPLPPEQWLDSQAKSAIHVKVAVKPGLPLGVVKQLLSLKTNKPDIAALDVAIDMTVVSDISVLRRSNFNDETNVLTLGPVPRETGTTVQLYLLVKGRYLDQVDFTVASTDPAAALQAEVGEPTQKTAKVRMFPVKITVPPNSPSVHRMGSQQGQVGRVVLDTQHPEIKQFTIRVLFVVQD